MILALAVMLAMASAPPATDAVSDAASALSHGRAVQAREMIRTAVAEGASGAAVDRLFADLAFAERRWPEATIRYAALLKAGERNTHVLSQAGIAALEQGDGAAAIVLLDEAAALPDAGWRTFNARGVAADRMQDWRSADAAYARGLRLKAASPELLNNLGWSLLLRGQWSEAQRRLAQAARLAPTNPRIASNLDLADSALLADLPARRAGESGSSYSARLNDAGALALHAGNVAKARAAFARALEGSDRWFARAANNLALADAAAGSP
ncbi:Flp pilus assembly protein TadD [Sphingomonas kaistensis]|uniref:Flp pilus assembly protein TadD n=1 Tax=Sphingomonas kaistensis TaxID=298708 RepID=A0A7X5YAM3_9SPHN|nr:hypothetical protein [Sphingomonas kaistensis]NJC06626.1 Flp pilus assembly protein TadD [Sphingomonas kaistensis]